MMSNIFGIIIVFTFMIACLIATVLIIRDNENESNNE